MPKKVYEWTPIGRMKREELRNNLNKLEKGDWKMEMREYRRIESDYKILKIGRRKRGRPNIDMDTRNNPNKLEKGDWNMRERDGEIERQREK